MKHHFLFRILAACCLLTLFLPLAACSSASGANISTLSEIKQDEGGHITFTLTLADSEFHAHSGEKILLYELLPGETFATRTQKDPIAEQSVSGNITFTLERKEGNHDRLYSAFLLTFADGTPVTDPKKLSNPDFGADSLPYLWSTDPKGLYVDHFSDALSLNLPHAAFTVDLASLKGKGSTVHRYGGTAYSISDTTLQKLDKNLKAAFDAGMQASLTVAVDTGIFSMKDRTALIDFLAERYAENGMVTSVFLDASTHTAENAAKLLSVTQYAFRSRNAGAKIYITAPMGSLKETQLYFAAIGELTAKELFDWGAAIRCVSQEAPSWENGDQTSLTPSTLSSLVSALRKQKNPPKRRAIASLALSAADPERQAAEFAHFYAKASESDFDLILLDKQTDALTGLYTASGEARPIADLFADIDTGLSEKQLIVCKNRSEELYTLVKELSPTHRKLSGTGNMGSGSGNSELLFDFTDGELHGFTAPAGGSLQSIRSDSYNAQVLYASFDKTVAAPMLTARLSDGKALENTTSLSFHFLAQYKSIANDDAANTCTLILTLTGTDTAGNMVTFRAKTSAAAHSWQNINFHISPFVNELDTNRPVIVSLSSEENEDSQSTALALWIKSVKTHSPQGDYGILLTFGISGGGILIGFLIIFIFYRKRSARTAKGEF